MSPSQIRLLQQSFAVIDPVKLDVGRSFFKKLAELSSQTQNIFDGDLDQRWLRLIGIFQQLMNRQLRSMLTLPATSTESKEAITPDITQLAQNYIENGFLPEHMPHVQAAFIWSLSHHLGDRLDAHTIKAWNHIIELVFNSMIQIMSSDAVQPVLPNDRGRTVNADDRNPMDLLFARPKPELATID